MGVERRCESWRLIAVGLVQPAGLFVFQCPQALVIKLRELVVQSGFIGCLDDGKQSLGIVNVAVQLCIRKHMKIPLHERAFRSLSPGRP